MDTSKLTELLRGTIDPNAREQVEDELSRMKKIIGFTPAILQVVMVNEMDMPIRQAGVIYLKNMITQFWKDAEYDQGDTIPFHIHEQDRVLIRESIVDAVVHAPDLIKVQLAVCTHQMIKYDFPSRWTNFVNKISSYLQNPDTVLWNGALLCLYQFAKIYEYKKHSDRVPFDNALKILLPMLYERIVLLLQNPSESSTILQKLILKILYASTQFHLSLDIFTREVFTQWMEVIRQIAERPVPDETNEVDEDERPDLPWWKVKKWAVHILARIFERYGCPSTVSVDYKKFAEWYIKTFSQGIFQVILKVFDGFHNKQFVSPRVLQQSLNYLECGVGQSHTWKIFKPQIMSIIQNVVFPLMCFSDADEELWKTDSHEYVRIKSDIYEDLVSPVSAAQSLLLGIIRKRKKMLESTMGFLVQVLATPNVNVRHKDGVFHMIGTIGSLLLKKQMYKDQMERMLCQYVFPECQSQYGFMRARACWLLQHLDDIKFEEEHNFTSAMNHIQRCLLNESDLPVKIEAAMALSAYLVSHDKAIQLLQPNMRGIVQELLKLIKETENDDLTNVMCKIVTTCTEELTPIAAEMCTELGATFQQVVESEEGADEKAITAMGLLSAIETLINCMSDNAEIMARIEPIALQVVALILNKNIIEYYEEALALTYSLTSSRISEGMWQCFEMIYNVFKNDGFDFFTEMMPALHNYVCVDTPGFLATEARLQAILEMCKTVLTNETGEDEQSHAAKLLEVVILQCHNAMGQYLTQIIQVTIQRMVIDVKTTELRTMLLQVVIAGLFTNPDVVLQVMETMVLPSSSMPLSTHFVKQWIQDVDSFFGLHDRKICVLGLCTLLQLGPERLPVLQECHKEILPSMVLLFQGLKRAYVLKANEENQDDEDEDEDDDDLYDDVLESDEDEIDLEGEDYLINLGEKVTKAAANSPFSISYKIQDEDSEEEDDDEDDELDKTVSEAYTTPLDKDDCEIDEYCLFKDVMQTIQTTSPVWYEALTSVLDEDQKATMLEVSTLADQRKAAAQSKKIQESGGYNFSQQTKVPTTFNFGGAFGSP